MSRDSRYDILFEPVQIGPVTAPNRFYQVPHCNGMGHVRPKSHAAMRGVKAEGGWGVICTEEVEIHPTGDISPIIEGRLWDDKDIPALRLMTEAVHEHGSLAGIELCHNSFAASNRLTRAIPLAPSSVTVDGYDPVQARAMDKQDIKNLRKWHRDAAIRSKEAGFDIVYVYAGHGLSLPQHFLSSRFNQRTDEYGGSLENRARLIKELLEDTKDAVGDTCAVAFRFAVDELMGPNGITCENEGHDVVAMLAELPDLWDVNVSSWKNDSQTARFAPDEGYQEKYTAFVKGLTTKPVVGVGRFTSADAMVSQIKRGVMDMIGAARPSIADPFLPRKIEEGRIDEIRECIGCNVCVSTDHKSVPIRCTQNPTMGEEWRRGWHPEKIAEKVSDDGVLIVGAGPAGLECALQLGRRGYDVTVAEARSEIGGRVNGESALPGLASWSRVRGYREYQLNQMANVDIYLESQLDVDQVLEFGFKHVIFATGSKWRNDGVGRHNRASLVGLKDMTVFTPDDVMVNADIKGHVVLFDDDHNYMGGVVAEKLIENGCTVTFVTPASQVSIWQDLSLDQSRIQARLMELGVDIITSHGVEELSSSGAKVVCVYSGRDRWIECNAVVSVTERTPNDSMFLSLKEQPELLANAGIETLKIIGDCEAPGLIAAAIYGGHKAARDFQRSDDPEQDLYRREMISLED